MYRGSFLDVKVVEWTGTLQAGGSFNNISVRENAGTLCMGGGALHDASVSEDDFEVPIVLFTSVQGGLDVFFSALAKHDDMRLDLALFIAFASFVFFVSFLVAEAFNMVLTNMFYVVL